GGGEVEDDRPVLRRPEVEGDRSPAAVAGVEVRRCARRRERRTPAAGLVARARPLHLDDIRAPVGHDLGRERAGEDPREGEEAGPGQGGATAAGRGRPAHRPPHSEPSSTPYPISSSWTSLTPSTIVS